MFQQFLKKIPIPTFYFWLATCAMFAAAIYIKITEKFNKLDLNIVDIIRLDYRKTLDVVGTDFLNQPYFWIVPPLVAFFSMFISSLIFKLLVLLARNFITAKFKSLSLSKYDADTEKNVNAERFSLSHTIQKIKIRVTYISILIGFLILLWIDSSDLSGDYVFFSKITLVLLSIIIYLSLFAYLTSDFFVTIFKENNSGKQLDCYRVLQDVFRKNYILHIFAS